MAQENNKQVKQITSMDTDFAQWYSDVCMKAELMDYSSVKGFIIYRPYGYAIWENIQNYLNTQFKKTGHDNVYMPLVIPESLFNKEKEHVEGFAPETACVTYGGSEELAEKLIIRPTSEVLFCEHYKNIVSSYRDLPKKYNQWCSVVRWEKTTRPFLRGKEFLWQEGHTIHETAKEAKEETANMLKIYKNMGKKLLAIPFVTGEKTAKEKFAGAENTYAIEALMHDGKALQSGTSHYFGQNFSKAFGIEFLNNENKKEFVYQTSWGVSTRLIGAIIMVHGDDNGLVLPPYVAPKQIVIIPIQSQKEEVQNACKTLSYKLIRKGYRVYVDNTNRTPGYKFSECEMRGIPLRIEIGPRDLENNEVTLVTRYNGVKTKYNIDAVPALIEGLLKEINDNMYNKALAHVTANTRVATTEEEFSTYINMGGYVKLCISGNEAENIIKEKYQATARVILREKPYISICPITNQKVTQVVLFARAY
ncbi:MAG: proline--tRNA ligase [Acholeplasmatales bacterium]|jgi:prolyl-tRNA synthetase|nr:proline--tRNA ligase [Acholeplasmatales bacterium]